MMRQLRAIRLIAAVLSLLFSSHAFGANVIEKLMMPGELSNAHAKLEENCKNCHVTFNRKAQDKLCLSCHKDVSSDQEKKTGFHGRNKIVPVSECAICHSEHRGREHVIAPLERILFNHDETDYPLGGRHKFVACEACHAQGKKFAAAPHECLACHDKDQPHKGQLGTKCEACHNVERWTKVAAFNHDTTKFPLKGAHAKVGCLSCHAGEVYKGVSTACNDCHALQDVHATRFGTACQDCHTVETWKGAKFDHAKSTRFPLLGVHAQAKCGDCHGGNVRQKISMACFDCHKSQDVHKAQLGSQCGECHGTAGWRQDVKFDHGLTSYPLTGLHTAVACESCHASAAFRGAPRACVACHASDDTHAGRFASRCEDCHSANGWQRVAFDHGRDTRFKLTGAHAKTGCYACHTQKNVKSASLPATCYACHKAQDVHHGAFGQDCTRCHTTATFKSAFIRQ